MSPEAAVAALFLLRSALMMRRKHRIKKKRKHKEKRKLSQETGYITSNIAKGGRRQKHFWENIQSDINIKHTS